MSNPVVPEINSHKLDKDAERYFRERFKSITDLNQYLTLKNGAKVLAIASKPALSLLKKAGQGTGKIFDSVKNKDINLGRPVRSIGDRIRNMGNQFKFNQSNTVSASSEQDSTKNPRQSLFVNQIEPVKAPKNNHQANFATQSQDQPTVIQEERDKTPSPEAKVQIETIPGEIGFIQWNSKQSNIAPEYQDDSNDYEEVEEPSIELEDGLSVINRSLQSLARNNQQNPQVQQTVEFLTESVQQAEENSREDSPIQTASTNQQKVRFNQNQAGSAVIDLFKSHNNGRNPMTAGKYQVERKGKSYFLKDKQGKVLLQARKTLFGTGIKHNSLNNEQKADLNYLREDLKLGEGISGNFKSRPPRPKTAEQTAQKEGFNPGKAIIKLFNDHSQDHYNLQTQKYNIKREGANYQVFDKSGNLLITTTKDEQNRVTSKGVFSPQLKYDLKVLGGDQRMNELLSGNFKVAGPVKESAETSKSPQSAIKEARETLVGKPTIGDAVQGLVNPHGLIKKKTSQLANRVKTKMTTGQKTNNRKSPSKTNSEPQLVNRFIELEKSVEDNISSMTKQQTKAQEMER